jgi:hypothetical protein
MFPFGKQSDKNAKGDVGVKNFQSYSVESCRVFLPKLVTLGELRSTVAITLMETE